MPKSKTILDALSLLIIQSEALRLAVVGIETELDDANANEDAYMYSWPSLKSARTSILKFQERLAYTSELLKEQDGA